MGDHVVFGSDYPFDIAIPRDADPFLIDSLPDPDRHENHKATRVNYWRAD